MKIKGNYMKLTGVTEYSENMDIEIDRNDNNKLVIRAYNQGGHDCTEIDLLELVFFLKKNMPSILN